MLSQEKEVVLVQSLLLFTRELLTGAETEAGSATLTLTLNPTLTPTLTLTPTRVLHDFKPDHAGTSASV